MAVVASKYEADAKDMRSALERLETLVAAKKEKIASLRQQAAHERGETKARQTYLKLELKTTLEALEIGKKEMTEVTSKYEPETAGARAGLVHGEVSAMAMQVEVVNLSNKPWPCYRRLGTKQTAW